MRVPTARTCFDRALGSSLAAWAGEGREAILRRMAPALRAPLASDPAESLEFALDSLARDHAAEVRFDPLRVHPTWWVRALADESEAVKRAVAQNAPDAMSRAIRLAFHLDDAALRPDRAADPTAVRWALTLWAERLVGGAPPRDDEPLVVRVVANSDRRSWGALFESVADRKRAESLASDARFAGQARVDVSTYTGVVYRDLPALGMVTIGRLLDAVEPFRARWTVQHLPYPVAKFLRSSRLMDSPHLSRAELTAWEAEVLSRAWSPGTSPP